MFTAISFPPVTVLSIFLYRYIHTIHGLALGDAQIYKQIVYDNMFCGISSFWRLSADTLTTLFQSIFISCWPRLYFHATFAGFWWFFKTTEDPIQGAVPQLRFLQHILLVLDCWFRRNEEGSNSYTIAYPSHQVKLFCSNSAMVLMHRFFSAPYIFCAFTCLKPGFPSISQATHTNNIVDIF